MSSSTILNMYESYIYIYKIIYIYIYVIEKDTNHFSSSPFGGDEITVPLSLFCSDKCLNLKLPSNTTGIHPIGVQRYSCPKSHRTFHFQENLPSRFWTLKLLQISIHYWNQETQLFPPEILSASYLLLCFFVLFCLLLSSFFFLLFLGGVSCFLPYGQLPGSVNEGGHLSSRRPTV